MPVQVQRSDYRLDRLIRVASVTLGVGVDLPPYSVARPFSQLVDYWDVNHIDIDGANAAQVRLTRGFLPLSARFFGVTEDGPLFAVEYYPLQGVFPKGMPLTDGAGIVYTAVTLAVPAGLPARDPLIDLPELDADGNAVFNNGDTEIGYQPQSVTITSGEIVRAGLDVTFDKVLPAALDELSIIGDDDSLNVVLSNEAETWAQLADSDVIPLQSPDGLAASQVIFEESRDYVMRTRPPEAGAIIDEGQRYGIASIRELSRGRFYGVSARRRYRAVSL